jgi:hypothetical protein
MKKLIYFSFILILSSCVTSKVMHVDKDVVPSKNNGTFYILPKTEFTVEITLTKTEQLKGPYAGLANKYLGLNNVVTENSVQYKISSIKVNSEDVDDAEQMYFIENPYKAFRSLKNLRHLGFIHRIIYEKAMGNADSTNFSTYIDNNKTESKYPDIFRYYADANLFMKVDTIIETVKLDTQFIEKKVVKSSMIEKSIEQKAKETADYIIKLRENKYNLISGTGEVNYQKESLEYMFTQLENMENEYMKLFTGITLEKTLMYRFKITPEANDSITHYNICHFSPVTGITRQNPGEAPGIFMNLKSRHILAGVEMVKVKEETLKKKSEGVIYRVPEYTDLSIIDGSQEIYRQTFPLWQIGSQMIKPVHAGGHHFCCWHHKKR